MSIILAITSILAMGAYGSQASVESLCAANKTNCGSLGGPEQRASQGLESLEDLVKQNVHIIRVFTQSGFGNRYATISFVRRPGQEPTLEIASVANPANKPALSIPIPLDDWLDANSAVAFFDADVPARPKADGRMLALPCLHPYLQRVEVVDRPETNGPMRIRQNAQSQCGYGPTYAAAVQLLRRAKRLIPACALLNDDDFADVAWLLSFCASINGDAVAVAQARNVYGNPWLERPRSSDYGQFLEHYFYDFAEMTWPDEPTVNGEQSVANLWAAKFSKLQLIPKKWTGLDGDHVEIKGVIVDPTKTLSQDGMLHFKLRMVKENGFDFRIHNMIVTAARP
ncbi:hypothetical protein EAH87_09980 [Sphingomonas koreensis]|nr:hypothetical protein EAH87_09980 [Sphingomonas koreensis]